MRIILFLICWLGVNLSTAQKPLTYTNPVLHADFSDPDVIRVGEDFYMVASSFNMVPGLPILHSTDLVHWSILNYALQELVPEKHFDTVQHGGGVWAPSIRYHKGEFYIFYPDPDFGIYVTKTKNIKGEWSKPVLVEAGKGLIDPCPLWDDNGKVYLVHAFAGSRAGIKSILVIKEMDPTATKIISNGVMVYDGHEKDPTIEGPKLYKRNGYYYIFAPGGGVSTGWQTVLRSKNIYGPYERKVVLEQGETKVNGPHQGAWVTTSDQKDWFLHFQDKEAYGRIVHLQPMQWKEDWPLMGTGTGTTKVGNPVSLYSFPFRNKINKPVPLQTSDDFNATQLGVQWQWQANPANNWAFPTPNGYLRLFSVYQKDSTANLWNTPNLLLQKFPAENFSCTVKLQTHLQFENEKSGLVIFGMDYAYIGVQKNNGSNFIVYSECNKADKGAREKTTILSEMKSNEVYLKCTVRTGAVCNFAYSADGITFINLPQNFLAKPGKWVGAKMGLFCNRTNSTNDAGFADVDYFEVTID